MTVHLIKLSVGPENLAELEAWQKQRYKANKELMHITRHTPKRAEEVLNGGSIYWVIKGLLIARQRIIELRPVTKDDGGKYCGIVLDRKMVRVDPRPRKPFQGWRYFELKDAPLDLDLKSGIAELPDSLQRELAELGLL